MNHSAPYRMLVIANETCPCPGLLDEVAGKAGAYDEHAVRIVAPALNSRLRHYLSDTDGALAAARVRLGIALDYLRDAGISAHGAVGDSDPFVALTDAMHEFDAHEVLLSTHPAGRSHWLERGLVERAQAELSVPVLHLESIYGVAALA